jgi:aspartyl-tRNA(Asn)/glutamyl-tRNA(Gln) amidotransferase subunit C
MSKLSREQILKLAKLSRLKLTVAEIEKYQKELSSILDYVERLEAVDVSDLMPTYQVTGLINQTRSDEVANNQSVSPDELLNRAPKTSGRYIKVGRMI